MKMILARIFTVIVSLTVVGSAYAGERPPEEILVAMASPKTVCGGNTGKACPGTAPAPTPPVAASPVIPAPKPVPAPVQQQPAPVTVPQQLAPAAAIPSAPITSVAPSVPAASTPPPSTASTPVTPKAAPTPTLTPAPSAPVAAISTYMVSASATSVNAGASVTATWTAPSGSQPKDWVGLYKVGDSNNSFGKWVYTGGLPSGTFTTTTPATAGTYEFRFLQNDGFTDVARSKAITVITATAAPTPTPSPTPVPILTPTPVATPVAGTGQTYYVSSGQICANTNCSNFTTGPIAAGNDSNNCTNISAPCLTLRGALAKIIANVGHSAPGVTLHLRTGVYDTENGLKADANHTLIPSGASFDAPFTFLAHDGPSTVTVVRGLNAGATTYTIAQMQGRNCSDLGGNVADCVGAPTLADCQHLANLPSTWSYPSDCWSGTGNRNGDYNGGGWWLFHDRSSQVVLEAVIELYGGSGYWDAPTNHVQYVVWDGIIFDARGIIVNVVRDTSSNAKVPSAQHWKWMNGEFKNAAASAIAQPSMDEIDANGQPNLNHWFFINFKGHHNGIPFNTHMVDGINARDREEAKFLHWMYIHINGNHCDNCEGYANAGDALTIGPGDVVKNSYIHDNACIGAQVGGGPGGPTIINNVFYNNGCADIQNNNQTNYLIANNTFVAGPKQTEVGIQIGVATQSGVIENNIIDGYVYGVKNYQCGPLPDGTCYYPTPNEVRNNLVRARSGGTAFSNVGSPVVQMKLSNNIVSQDPKFVNQAAGDYRLQAGSPAINAGLAYSLTGDRAGCARNDGKIDIGAYEYNTNCTPAPLTAPVATAVPNSTPAPTQTAAPTPASSTVPVATPTAPSSCTTNCGTTKTLTVNATNAANGVTITMEPTDVDGLSTCNAYPCVRHYKSNTIVTVHAPDMSQSGYYDRWSGGCDAINNNEPFLCTVTMGADKAVSASFGGDGCRIRKDIAIGQTVTICWNGPINVFSFWDNSGGYIGDQPVASSGTVIGGPFNYDNDSDYVNVNFNTGVDGWLTTGNIINGRPPTTKFQIGSRVRVNATALNVRQSSSVTSASLGTHSAGDQGTVIAGRIRNLGDNTIWWNIKYDAGAGSTAAGGWSAEDFLSLAGTSIAATPTVTPTVPPTPTPAATPVPASVGSYSLWVPTTSVSGGGTVTATWSAPTGSSPKDWVALYKVGDSNNSFIAGKWIYIGGAASGTFTTTVPTTSGTYEFRLLKNDGYTDVTRSNAITVVGTTPPATPTPTSQPTATPPLSGANVYYVSSGLVCGDVNCATVVDGSIPAGDDNTGDGSQQRPFKTLPKALKIIGTNGAGYTVVLRGGAYDTINGLRTDSNSDTLIPTGSSWSAPFTIKASPGEAVTLIRGLNPGATLTVAQMQSPSCNGLDCVGAPTLEECIPMWNAWNVPQSERSYPDNCWSGGGSGMGLYIVNKRAGHVTQAVIDASSGYERPTKYVIFDGILFDARGINHNIVSNTTTYGKVLIQKHYKFLNGEWKNSAGSCMAQPGIGGEWEYDAEGKLHTNEFEFINFKIHHCGIPFNTLMVNGVNAREHPTHSKFLHGWYMHLGGNTCDHCEAYKNAGNGVGPDGPNNIIRNSYIHDNSAQGIYMAGGNDWIIENNIFTNNRGAEIYHYNAAGHVIRNNTVVAGPHNTTYAMYLHQASQGSLYENNIVVGFRYPFYNSQCGVLPNGSCYYTAPNTLKNNLVVSTVPGSEIGVVSGQVIPIIESGTIKNQDPRFVNPAAGDFRLQGSSPAINAGANNGLATDKTGKARNGTIDIGAFEFGN